MSSRPPLVRLADGTVKQINPFTGTEVWTVPGRANRPLRNAVPDPHPLAEDEFGKFCAFCEDRKLETTPEKARVVRSLIKTTSDETTNDDTTNNDTSGNKDNHHRNTHDASGLTEAFEGDAYHWYKLFDIPASELDDTIAEFRVVGNLFESVSLRYWELNHGYHMTRHARAHQNDYIADPSGNRHLTSLVHTLMKARGEMPTNGFQHPLSDSVLRRESSAFFGGCHDVVIARRHYIDGATSSDQLASSGTLTPEEHAQFIRLSTEAMHRLYADNPFARYVSVFQNWLKPAGSTFDHLHKQLVAIDELPVKAAEEHRRVSMNPALYQQFGADFAASHGLMVAENDHAVAFIGFGHRFPTLEVYSKSPRALPWQHSSEQLRGISDLVHACHSSIGSSTSCNEEWQHRPPGLVSTMPWHILIKLRVSTIAGFEGATGIYLNTIDPWSLHTRTVSALEKLRDECAVAAFDIGEECETAKKAQRNAISF